MLFSTAYADEATGVAAIMPSGDASPLMSIAPLALIFVVFYFLIIRPQQRKIKDHNDMIKALRRGDKVVTAGGVIGVINKVEADDILVLEVAPDIRIRVIRDTISNVITKTVANDNKVEDKTTDKAKSK
jgi:preprotein translocase subunit YajC